MNRASVYEMLNQLINFHKNNLQKVLPSEIYKYLGEFLLPDYKNIPLIGKNLAVLVNLPIHKFPSSSPWNYKNKNGVVSSHIFNKKYTLSIGHLSFSTSRTLLGIDFLKVKFDNYFLPILNFRNRDTLPSYFQTLKNLSQIKDFDKFKSKIQESFDKGNIFKRLSKIRKSHDYKCSGEFYQGSQSNFSDFVQKLVKDIEYFHSIIHDSRNNYFKLRHIYYLLPKLLRSFIDTKTLIERRKRVYIIKVSESYMHI